MVYASVCCRTQTVCISSVLSYPAKSALFQLNLLWVGIWFSDSRPVHRYYSKSVVFLASPQQVSSVSGQSVGGRTVSFLSSCMLMSPTRSNNSQ